MNKMDNSFGVAECKETPPDLARGDTLTIVRSAGLLVAKLWQADGEIRQYDQAKYFDLREARVNGIGELSTLLTELENDPHACIIRGRYVGDALAKEREQSDFKPGKVLRRNSCFDDQKLHTILIEIDKFATSCDPIADPVGAIDEFIRQELPEAFSGVSFHWQLSSSAGHPTKGKSLRAHVWFWLSVPRTSAELKTWASALNRNR